MMHFFRPTELLIPDVKAFNINDLNLLGTAPLPILTAWKEAVQLVTVQNSWITVNPSSPTLPHQFSSLNSKPVSTILQLHRFQQFQDCKYVGLGPQECYTATKTWICKVVQLLHGVSQYDITASNKGGSNKPSQGFLLPLSKSKKLMAWTREYKNSCQ